MADVEFKAALLSQLKTIGLELILDAFGSGPSSLTRLRQFPLDALKIDRSLIGEMQADRVVHEVVELIITVAHRMNLKVIADGMELPKQLDQLRAWGCELGQGHLFAPALDANAAEQYLQQQGAETRASGAGR